MKPDARSVGGQPDIGTRRVLVHIPIAHSQVDMGSYGERVRRAYVEQKGADAWRESRLAIDAFWDALENAILALDIDFGRVRLYQDTLPVCGREADIVGDLAATGAANYRILFELMGRGAALEGTENPELLLREYERLKADQTETGPSASQETGAERHDGTTELVRARDRFIADRIDRTLRPGEIGLLFIGALHDVAEFLPGTINIMSLEEFRVRPTGH